MVDHTRKNPLTNDAEPTNSPLRVLLIACLSIGLGTVTNRWLNANSNDIFQGEVQVETLLIRAPVDGILQAWHVHEGETIDPNVMLCQIGGHNLSRQIQMNQQNLARLETRLATLQAEVDVKLHEHLRTVESDIYQAELQTADLLQKKYYYEIEAIAWKETLEAISDEENETDQKKLLPTINSLQSEAGLPTDRQINAMLKHEAATNNAEATTAQLAICNGRLAKLKKQKQEIQERVRLAVGLAEVELELAHAREERTRLELQMEQQNIRSTVLGTVANFRRKAGEYVQAGEILADLYQLNDAYVVANVPTRQSHQFAVNATVKCQFPNGETRTGVVTNVAVHAMAEDPQAKTAGSTVPLRIEPTGALWPTIPVGGEVTILR